MTDPIHVNQNAQAEGIVLQHALKGDLVSNLVPTYATGGEDVGKATRFSTAPYIAPEDRKPKVKLCKANEGTCKGSPMPSTGYCSGHSRSMGLIENWSTKDGKE